MQQQPGACLASMEGFGQVYDCGSCGCVHVQAGPVTITLEPQAYLQFVALLNDSAASFESWLAYGPLAAAKTRERDRPGGGRAGPLGESYSMEPAWNAPEVFIGPIPTISSMHSSSLAPS